MGNRDDKRTNIDVRRQTADRRRFLQLSAAAGAGLALKPDMTSASAQTEEPQRGGDLRVGLAEDPPNLNPYGPAGGYDKRNAMRGIFDTLVHYDSSGEWIPALAESWEVGDEGQSLTFQIRPGVEFHDGTACDAEAIKWIVDSLWLDLEVGSAGLRAQFESVEVLDDRTVRFLLTQPDSTAMAALSQQFIVSPTAYQELGEDEFGLRPVGSGPFAFGSWQRGVELVLERNPNYWDPERPYVDRLIWRVISDDTIRRVNLTSGEIEVMTRVPLQDVSSLQDTDGIEVGRTVGGYSGLIFNTADPPFDQLANREAFVAAIDYQALVNAVYFGIAEPSTGGFIPPSNFAFNDDLSPLQRDLELASTKLEEAGNPDGFEVLATLEPASEASARLMEAVQAMVAEVGIELRLEVYDRGRFTEILQQDPHAVQMAQYTIAFIHPTPEQRLGFADCGAAYNPLWCSDEYSQALAEARSATDSEERIAALHRAEEVLVEEKPMTSLVWLPTVHAWSTSVHGYSVDYVGDVGWQTAWISES